MRRPQLVAWSIYWPIGDRFVPNAQARISFIDQRFGDLAISASCFPFSNIRDPLSTAADVDSNAAMDVPERPQETLGLRARIMTLP